MLKGSHAALPADLHGWMSSLVGAFPMFEACGIVLVRLTEHPGRR